MRLGGFGREARIGRRAGPAVCPRHGQRPPGTWGTAACGAGTKGSGPSSLGRRQRAEPTAGGPPRWGIWEASGGLPRPGAGARRCGLRRRWFGSGPAAGAAPYSGRGVAGAAAAGEAAGVPGGGDTVRRHELLLGVALRPSAPWRKTVRSSTLRRCGMALALGLATPVLLEAQYFGRNKVQYESFDWKIIQTEHFDVYFYPAERVAAMDAARMAERSYARLSRVLGHHFYERKAIILYASSSDFVQTNTTPGDVGEGTGGFTDFSKQRNIMPLTGAYRDIDHVLTHEMAHQFQLDVFSGGLGGSALQSVLQIQPPLWFMEGMAEYLSLGPVTPE